MLETMPLEVNKSRGFCTISGTCSTMIIKQLGVNAMYVDSLLQHIDISSMIHASAKAK
jgi:hypothetical protein